MICKDCGKEFEPKKRENYCDLCSMRKARKEGYESSIKRMIRNRDFIKNYKEDKKCEICGYNKHPEILDFHHKDKEEKNKGVNILMKSLKNIDTIKREINKCILLCPNCHRELHILEEKNNKKNEN